MKTADIYIRVSTDEQAEKGYSQRNQEEMLRKYCELNAIQVRRTIYEDHSAKTFNRLEWQKLLADLRKHRGQTDLILFTKWDRFSRNAGDAYQMISLLRKTGVEPQAIEQPLPHEWSQVDVRATGRIKQTACESEATDVKGRDYTC